MPAIRRVYVDIKGTIWSLSYDEFRQLVAEGAENGGKFTLRGRQVKNSPSVKIYDMRAPWGPEEFRAVMLELEDEEVSRDDRRH